ncbi:glycosyltransferase family 2 protein [Flavobacterium daejeonense]|uniref:glycosyltransferase family 2 protein n=1 Tax=Flavobacterium daejeonense TaxID=350893 RepID=UPI000557A0A2|nr:glycosyltransferase [Flavobacterium daejeonense]
MTKFSILIANYNNGHFFKDCYDSIIAQTYTNWEVIIVDDASTDNSLELIKTQIGDDPRFVLVQNDQNGGCGYTKKRCAELATGELCGFLDPDDALMPEAVQVMVKEHQLDINVSMVYSNYYSCDEKLKPKYIYKGTSISGLSCLEFGNSITHFVSFKSKNYKASEGINPDLRRAVDQDLYYKLEEQGAIKYLDSITYKYRIHKGGISTNNNSAKAFANHMFVIFLACKRRNLRYEDIIPIYYKKYCNIENVYFKTGLFILKPFKFVHKIIKNHLLTKLRVIKV